MAFGRVDELGPAPVVERERQRHLGVVARVSASVSSMRRRTRPGTRPPRRPMNRTRTPLLVQLVAARHQQALVEVHEEAHFVERPAPVLGGEREDRHPREADLERALDGVEERLLPRGVALGALQAPLLRPPPVAVHDDRDVGRHPVGVEVHHRFGPYPGPIAAGGWKLQEL